MLLRRTALWTFLAFGCTTVRVPVTALEQPADAPGAIAPPIIELWLESSGEVPPAVATSADARARAALSAALAGLEVPANAAGATDAVLFVRERAVGLTEERRSQQTWAKVGIVVGIVVVAAVVVYLAVKGSSSSKASPAPAKAASAPSTPAPVAVRPHVVPVSPRPPVPPSVGLPGPYRAPSVEVAFFFQVWFPPGPLVLAPETPPDDPWGVPGPPLLLDALPSDPDEVAEPPPPDPFPMSAVALQLPPLAEAVNFAVEDRGFFAGPHTALQLDLIDRASGRLLWSRAVAGGEDPLDEGAISKLLDEVLAGQGWARR